MKQEFFKGDLVVDNVNLGQGCVNAVRHRSGRGWRRIVRDCKDLPEGVHGAGVQLTHGDSRQF